MLSKDLVKNSESPGGSGYKWEEEDGSKQKHLVGGWAQHEYCDEWIISRPFEIKKLIMPFKPFEIKMTEQIYICGA